MLLRSSVSGVDDIFANRVLPSVSEEKKNMSSRNSPFCFEILLASLINNSKGGFSFLAAGLLLDNL